jgi:hypothetical protein
VTGLIQALIPAVPLSVLLVVLTIAAFSAVKGESAGTGPGSNWQSMKQDTVCIRGQVYVAGNEPFTELVVEREGGNTAILRADGDLYRELWSQQGQELVLFGILESDPVHGTIFIVHAWEPPSSP